MDALEFSRCKDVLVIWPKIHKLETDRKLFWSSFFDPTTSCSKKDNTDQDPVSLLREESHLKPIFFPVPCNMNRSVSFNYFEIDNDKDMSIIGISAYPEEWFVLQESFSFLFELFSGLKVSRMLRPLGST